MHLPATLGCAVALVMAAPATAIGYGFVEDGVATTGPYPVTPAAHGRYLVYATNSSGHPSHFDAYLKLRGHPKIRLNPRGSGFGGGIDDTAAVDQQVVRRRSTIHFYDLASGVRSAAPALVNAPTWQWRPTVSGDWVLFGRRNFSSRAATDAIMLWNRSTDELRTLATDAGHRKYLLTPGQVNGNWATWYTCAHPPHTSATCSSTTSPRKPRSARNDWRAPSTSRPRSRPRDTCTTFAHTGPAATPGRPSASARRRYRPPH